MYVVIKRKHLLLLTFGAVLLLAIPISAFFVKQSVTTAAANTNWGLGFRKNGEQPSGNASATFLKQYDAYYLGAPDKKVLYLTFDAGYENGYMPTILDTLKKQNVKACFFLVGNYLDTSPDLVKRMVAEGHLVGNHTSTHPDMSKISEMPAFQKELQGVEQKFKTVTGKDLPKFYRPPQGKYCVQNLQQAKQLGYHTIFWSLAYVDWYQDKQPTKEQAFAKLLPRVHPGAVVLLHSTSATNANILDELIEKWKAEGYTFGTLDQLVAQ